MDRRPGDGMPSTRSPGRHARGHHLGPLDHADREADQVELAGLHRSRVFGHLAADESAACLAAPLGNAADQLLDLRRVELADRDVVEEEQGLGALTHEVVDAHGDEIDPDGVETTGRTSDHGLGSHAVGGGHQNRLPVAGGIEPEQTAEPSDVTDHLRAERGAHVCLDPLHRLLARVDRDPGRLVGLTHQNHVPLFDELAASSAGMVESPNIAPWNSDCGSGATVIPPSRTPLPASGGIATGYCPVRHAVQKPAPGAPTASRSASRDR